jgi:uncharacterized protein DUF3489
MRHYVIRGSEVEVCRKRPRQLQEGDLVVTSAEALHDARLPAKQLLAILNGLSGATLKKLGDRHEATDRLWAALQQLPAAASGNTKEKPPAPRESKQAQVIAMLRRREGATIEAIMAATGWQQHTVRGAISGALKKKLGLAVIVEKRANGARVYRIADAA